MSAALNYFVGNALWLVVGNGFAFVVCRWFHQFWSFAARSTIASFTIAMAPRSHTDI
jgi:hypothetical protein